MLFTAQRASTRFSEPLGDDCFGTGGDRHALMQGVRIGLPVRVQVVPDQGLTQPGPEGEPGVHEVRLTAGCRLVEIDHEGPAALAPGCGRIPLELIRLEVIGVRLELLADLVVLALGRFGIGPIGIQRGADLSIELANDGIALVEVAGPAGPEGRFRSALRGDGGGPEPRPDELDQGCANARLDEIIDGVELEPRRAMALQSRKESGVRRAFRLQWERRRSLRRAARRGTELAPDVDDVKSLLEENSGKLLP